MSWVVPTHRAVWIPPGIEHELVMLGAVEFHVVYIEPKASPLSLIDCGVIEIFPLSRELVRSLADGPNLKPRHRNLMIDLLLEEIRAAPTLSLGLPLPSDSRLKVLCDRLMEEPSSSLSLAEWARIAGASERTLARLFRSELSASLGSWRQQLRLAQAVGMMARRTPLAIVAQELGYNSPAAFSTMFKRVLGIAPSRFIAQQERVVTARGQQRSGR